MSLETGSSETSHPMEFLLSQELNLPTTGEVRTGWIVKNRNGELFVDIGAKSEGIVPSRETDQLDKSIIDEFVVGNEISVYIVDPEDQNGNIILSYVKAAQEKDWVTAEKLLESQDVYEGPVIGFNRGGVLVKLGQIRGFVPNSQLSSERFSGRVGPEKTQKLVGEKLRVKVVEVDRERNRLIMSERAAYKEIREAKRQELLENIQEGDKFDGRVINLTDYGAFVNIGGIEGLVHLSELSWKRIKSPADVLQVGDEIRVVVISVDIERQRIALSLKRLEPDPWTKIDEIYYEGQLIEATVTKLMKFGAFARLNDDYELEGLIHISEMAEEHVNHPREIVNQDEQVSVRIIRIDPDQRQLGLSIKQVSSAKYLEMDMAMMSSD